MTTSAEVEVTSMLLHEVTRKHWLLLGPEEAVMRPLTRLWRLGASVPPPRPVKRRVAWQIGRLRRHCVGVDVGRRMVWHEEAVVTWQPRPLPDGNTVLRVSRRRPRFRNLHPWPWQRPMPPVRTGVRVDPWPPLACTDYAKLESFPFLPKVLNRPKWSSSTWFFDFDTRF